MADSPLCEKCIDEGRLGHTYKVAGKPLFRCGSCKVIYKRSDFEQIQMEWASKPVEYVKWRQEKKLTELVHDKSNSRVIRLKKEKAVVS